MTDRATDRGAGSGPTPLPPAPRPTAGDVARRPDAPGPLGAGTLGRQILVRVVVIVAAVAIGLSTVTALALQRQLVGQIDEQLDSVVGRQVDYPGRGPEGRPEPRARAVLAGQPVGTLVIQVEPTGEATGSVLSSRIQPQTITAASIREAVAAADPERNVTVDLDGLGRYRLASRTLGEDVIVVGVPLDQVDTTMRALIALEIIVTTVATLIAAAVVGALVTRSLRPLSRLAQASREVSDTPLDSGRVDLSVRVPAPPQETGSEVGRLTASFNHMIEHVAGALAAREASETRLRRFVADASHELRNPLAAIRGYAELTRRDRNEQTPATVFALERVESEAQRMSSLVEDMLLLARLDAGREMVREPVDLVEVAVNAVSDARAAGRDHRWQLRLPDAPVTVTGDADRLHQVVVNLLANARTHTPAGTTVEVGVAHRTVDGAPRAVLSVTDDGPGIDPELLPHVFERFTRGDSGRSRADGNTSTGLGLAIVGAVIAGHDGDVRVESVSGRTVFEVRLPV